MNNTTNTITVNDTTQHPFSKEKIPTYKDKQKVTSTKVRVFVSGKFDEDTGKKIGITYRNPSKPLSKRDKHRREVANRKKYNY